MTLQYPLQSSDLQLDWDSPTDTDNPKNWQRRRRVVNASILACVGLLSSVSSSVMVPAIPDVMEQFGVQSKTIGILTTSVYVLGLGFGPFMLAPMSELFGRWVVYSSTLSVFTLFQIGCALSNSMPLLIVLRFLEGTTGSMAPTLGQASMADIWDADERGCWTAVLTLGPLLGPPLGGFLASLILSRERWPWVFWVLSILSGFLTLLLLFVVHETYEPVILRRRRAKRLAAARSKLSLEKRSSDSTLDSDLEDENSGPSPAALFLRALTRPLRLLIRSPIILILGVFLAYIYGILYLLLVSLPLLFGSSDTNPGSHLFNYNFSHLQTGFSYLGLALGFVIGCIVQMYAQSKIWSVLTARTGQQKAEYRLLPMSVGMTLFPISLLWYGWSAEAHAPWIIPEIGTVIFGMGMFIAFQSIQVYIVEAFVPYSASAIAAATLLRCTAGAGFPLFGEEVFKTLGYGWAGTLLALLAVPAIPVPYLLYNYGPYLRKRFEFVP